MQNIIIARCIHKMFQVDDVSRIARQPSEIIETSNVDQIFQTHQSKRHNLACNQTTEERSSPSRSATSGSGQDTLGQVDWRASSCRSDACRYSDRRYPDSLIRDEPSREDTCCCKQRNTHTGWFATQNTLNRQGLDNRADYRTFTCVTNRSWHAFEQSCFVHLFCRSLVHQIQTWDPRMISRRPAPGRDVQVVLPANPRTSSPHVLPQTRTHHLRMQAPSVHQSPFASSCPFSVFFLVSLVPLPCRFQHDTIILGSTYPFAQHSFFLEANQPPESVQRHLTTSSFCVPSKPHQSLPRNVNIGVKHWRRQPISNKIFTRTARRTEARLIAHCLTTLTYSNLHLSDKCW